MAVPFNFYSGPLLDGTNPIEELAQQPIAQQAPFFIETTDHSSIYLHLLGLLGTASIVIGAHLGSYNESIAPACWLISLVFFFCVRNDIQNFTHIAPF